MIELILLGVVAGSLVSLLPGMHPNNFMPLLAMLPLAEASLFFFVVPFSIASVFSSFIPSILLGAPSSETALAVLPGHKMLRQGRGYTAIVLCLAGGLVSIVSLFILLPFIASLLPVLYPPLSPLIAIVLAAVLAWLLLSNRFASVILVMSASLGMMTFSQNTLLPLLSGFFGVSTLMMSLRRAQTVPLQPPVFLPRISAWDAVRSGFAASLFASFFGLLPGVSSSISATVARFLGRLHAEEFLVMLGATNTAYMLYSFYAFSLLGIVRSGSVAALQSEYNVFMAAGAILLAGGLSFLLCRWLAGRAVKVVSWVDYRYLTAFSLAFLVAVNAVLGGFYGLVVLFASSSLGILCASLGVKRINCMAALIVPAIAGIL